MPTRRKNEPPPPRRTPAQRRHAATFGPDWQYLDWCRAHGFRLALDKTPDEMAAETAVLDAGRVREAAQSKLHRRPEFLIAEICAGRMTSDQIDRPTLKEFCAAIEKSRGDGDSREALARLLLFCLSKTDFTFESRRVGGRDVPYAAALVRLNDRRGQWRRPLEDFRPSTHNAARQFAALARHLLADYPVPAFMDEAWFRTGANARLYRDWFAHIGAGKNLRTAKTPVPLTKTIAHRMMQAPADFTIEGAIRWGQVHAADGDRRLVDAVLSTRLGETFDHDEFWQSAIRFFIAHPMLDRSHFGPVVDFLHHHKFATREVLVGRGVVEVEGPPQPNLSMRGRTPETLLQQVDRWHADLGRTRRTEMLHFRRSGLKELSLKSGRGGEDLWTIRELLSSAELHAEGAAMRHCVSSYDRACAAGAASIWSMEHRAKAGPTTKHQTVEVRRGEIVQSRGRLNRWPTAAEFEVLRVWADYAGLTVSPYVRAAA